MAGSGVHERLAARRRAEFAAKWRFNRLLRALVASPAAVGGGVAGRAPRAGRAARRDRVRRRRRACLKRSRCCAIVFVPMLVEARARGSQRTRPARTRRHRAAGRCVRRDAHRLSRCVSRDDRRRRLALGARGAGAWRRRCSPASSLFILAKALKWWAILSLGRSWTFRVIVVPGDAPVASGPYAWLRHPNYVGRRLRAGGRRADVAAPA